jgi:hypothetical protein
MCQTFALDETHELMSGIVVRSKGLTLPRWTRLGMSHNKEEIACDADEDAIDGEPTGSPVKVRRASHVVDDDPTILLAHECLDNRHPPALQRGMPVILHRQALRAEEDWNGDDDDDDAGSGVRGD